jgi:hypothetical protein
MAHGANIALLSRSGHFRWDGNGTSGDADRAEISCRRDADHADRSSTGRGSRGLPIDHETRITRISHGSTRRGSRGFLMDQRDADHADFSWINETRITRISHGSTRRGSPRNFSWINEARITRIPSSSDATRVPEPRRGWMAWPWSVVGARDSGLRAREGGMRIAVWITRRADLSSSRMCRRK